MPIPTTYCGIAAETAPRANTAQPILHTAKPILQLTADLSRSLRRPSGRTLTLIDKALAWLRPFESTKAMTASSYEKRELLELLTTHRGVLLPYIDTERVESHLRRS